MAGPSDRPNEPRKVTADNKVGQGESAEPGTKPVFISRWMVLCVIPPPELGSGLKNAKPGLQPRPVEPPSLAVLTFLFQLFGCTVQGENHCSDGLQEKGDDALWKNLWASCRKSRRGTGKLPSSSRCFCSSRDAEPLFQEHGKGGVSSALTMQCPGAECRQKFVAETRKEKGKSRKLVNLASKVRARKLKPVPLAQGWCVQQLATPPLLSRQGDQGTGAW